MEKVREGLYFGAQIVQNSGGALDVHKWSMLQDDVGLKSVGMRCNGLHGTYFTWFM